MRSRTPLAAVLAGTLLACLHGAPAAHAASCPDQHLVPARDNVPRAVAAIVCLHNQERRAAGVKALRPNPLLATAATRHSEDMVVGRYFGHSTLAGLDPFDRLRRAGYIRRGFVWNAGENIAWGSGRLSTPRSIMDAWMRSYGHRLAVLASDFDELGVGIAIGAPDSAHAGLASAVTYTVDFGWRERSRRPAPATGQGPRGGRGSAGGTSAARRRSCQQPTSCHAPAL